MTKTELDFKAVSEAILSSAHTVLVSHEFTDGDDLGAMLACKFALQEKGLRTTAVAKGGVQDNLTFLPGVLEVKETPPKENYDTVVYFGCGSADRSGFENWDTAGKKIINIDHHIDNRSFGDINFVDAAAAATCELVYHLIKFWNVPISKPIAINLLTGIFNDTGGFRHANTNAQVLEIAAELMRHGASISRISEFYFGKNELSKLRAWAKALENMHFDSEQQMVYSIVTEEELKEAGADPEDLEGIASVLNTVPEAKFSMVLKQRGDEIKGSLRSENYKGVDVAAIARTLGGGGHKLAAGFKLKGKIEKTEDGWKIT
ncbi:MAG: bifunctional oligoribonuclease/PAP phosphatase NrnA [Patescibacteria group bacterium]|nr:bifunctional oligoribonuclease/PAP phosphatase NrnA [Patescibacteria group bacterium]